VYRTCKVVVQGTLILQAYNGYRNNTVEQGYKGSTGVVQDFMGLGVIQ